MSARLVLRERGGAVHSFAIDAQASIGSSADANVVISGDRVSAIHARITSSADGYWIEDAQSGAGTFVNGQKIDRIKLRHFDVITVGGDISLVFLSAQPDSARVEKAELLPDVQTIAGKSPLSPGGMPKFAMTINEPIETLMPQQQGGQVPQELLRAMQEELRVNDETRATGPIAPPPVRPKSSAVARIAELRLVGPTGTFKSTLGTCIVGRDAEAGVRIQSKEISRRHAVIVITPDGITVEDLNSANGTRVNSSRISAPTPIVDGDTVAFSSFKFRVEIVSAESR